jgi:hypothetical protein
MATRLEAQQGLELVQEEEQDLVQVQGLVQGQEVELCLELE